ncbi:unnamed protein product [Didymodactylos carnosus]|uniref:Reverse transcriptase/retrotransposon-derived protein RNase H-like domain-containing protein n=1 Tax=Didymodactylos carnosus TaxID=1234261 RepID=A0A813VTZ7_9BILA|nr:unnamed protein product [Didymodactylos carnosus]CAF0848123.1 unnamed protein product [Didymodactylos carnosus]CAF3561761.1 unnamed protein product [Didymodactylos carnosus]CAF3635774.1 unnamed protein product [Didymodactylos carnosus]
MEPTNMNTCSMRSIFWARTAPRKQDYVFVFTLDRQRAFELLNERLISTPIVTYPNFNHPFMLQLDACGYGFGAVLAQNIERIEHVITGPCSLVKENIRPAVLGLVEKYKRSNQQSSQMGHET